MPLYINFLAPLIFSLLVTTLHFLGTWHTQSRYCANLYSSHYFANLAQLCIQLGGLASLNWPRKAPKEPQSGDKGFIWDFNNREHIDIETSGLGRGEPAR